MLRRNTEMPSAFTHLILQLIWWQPVNKVSIIQYFWNEVALNPMDTPACPARLHQPSFGMSYSRCRCDFFDINPVSRGITWPFVQTNLGKEIHSKKERPQTSSAILLLSCMAQVLRHLKTSLIIKGRGGFKKSGEMNISRLKPAIKSCGCASLIVLCLKAGVVQFKMLSLTLSGMLFWLQGLQCHGTKRHNMLCWGVITSDLGGGYKVPFLYVLTIVKCCLWKSKHLITWYESACVGVVWWSSLQALA